MDAIWPEIISGVQKVFTINTERQNSNEQKQILITKNEYIRLYTIIYDSCNRRTPEKPVSHQGPNTTQDPAKYIYESINDFITEYITSL